MSQLYYGSICYTDLLEKLQQGHSSASRASNGKVYVNINLWVNDEPDKYSNHGSISLSSKKEKVEEEGRTYLGNFKKSDRQEPEPISGSEFSGQTDKLPWE